MANSIAYAQRFVPIIDAIYKNASVTAGMDAATKPDFSGVNEVKVLKVSTTGLGDYSRTNGYPKGDVTAAWETLKLTEERGKEITVDRMDDEETLGMVFGTVTGEFMRLHVVPELDAYRFAKYASATGVSAATAATLTKDTILPAFDEAARQMDEDEVPANERYLYITPLLLGYIQDMDTTKSREVMQNFSKITKVPQTRFYTAIEQKDGKTAGEEAGGYAKAAEAKDINFMIIHKPALIQFPKHIAPKIIEPAVNQSGDAYKFGYRQVAIADVYENKVAGIYLHHKA